MAWCPGYCFPEEASSGHQDSIDIAQPAPLLNLSWELRRKATGVEACKVEGGETSIFKGDFKSSAYCSAVSTATANAEKTGRKGKYALFFGGGRVKGVVLNIHVTVATGLPKDTQMGEPVPKRERVSNPHDAVVVGTSSFPPQSPRCLSASLEDGSLPPTQPPAALTQGKDTPASRVLSHILFLNPTNRPEGQGPRGPQGPEGGL